MITKEEIICGSKEEIIEYFNGMFNFIDRSAENDAKGITYYFMPDNDIGTIETQLNRIDKRGMGMIFFFKVTPDLTNKQIGTTIVSFWVFIRASNTNDAKASL